MYIYVDEMFKKFKRKILKKKVIQTLKTYERFHSDELIFIGINHKR